MHEHCPPESRQAGHRGVRAALRTALEQTHDLVGLERRRRYVAYQPRGPGCAAPRCWSGYQLPLIIMILRLIRLRLTIILGSWAF